ncbi:MAG: hypothetical protein P0S96_03495 [Simkaniaceae bacterium]|nr:hypothetical protein [Candidatus Sacchlamyda saccharinae]
MINPVSGPTRAESPKEAKASKAPTSNYGSTIRSGRRNTFPFMKMAEKYLLEIWNWVKYNIFFCVFDAEEEKEESLKKQLEEYVELYFDREAVPSNERAKELRKIYRGLDPEIKEEIETAIVEILKEAQSDLSEARLKILVKRIIQKPFSTIQDKTKPKEQQRIHVMGKAILQVVNKLAGYTKE